jgi:hypothetical protein
MEKLDFFERARKLGHTPAALKSGKSVRSELTLPDIDSLKDILSHGGTAKERSSQMETLFGDTKMAKGDSQEAFMSRINSFLFGNADLADDDRSKLTQAFPMTVTAVSADDHTYGPGKNDLGTSQNLVILNYNNVTIADQGYVTIQNTPLQFTCDTLTRTGSAPSGHGDFNILGVTGGAQSQAGTGATGGNGSAGKKGNCSSAGIAGDSGQNGTAGKTGGTGGSGIQGNAGLPSQMAQITITTTLDAASFTVLTRSGTGGQGGQGGKGGTGGNGGKGGNGASCGCTGSGAGNGASGGKGGNGGVGGMGGNGVNAAANIVVTVPATDVGKVFPNKQTAPPGGGGLGGPGGAGGSGGGKGSGGKHNGDGSAGSTGGKGNTGGTGVQGTASGTPAEISVQPY